MSLGNWEGKISDEAEPEELPDFVAKKVTARDGLVKIIIILTLLPCTKYEDKSVFLYESVNKPCSMQGFYFYLNIFMR